jgi:hypothetical protein
MSITAFTSSIASTFRWSASDTQDLATATDSKRISDTLEKTYGTGVGQANLIWHQTYSAGGTIVLSALPRSVFNITGNYSMTTLKTVRIRNTGAASATVTVPGCGITSAVTLHAGGLLLLDSDTGWAAGGNIVITGSTAVEVVLVGVGTGEV